MTTDKILEPSDTLGDALRLAENIKIAYELVEEKSPKGNKKLNYLLKNLNQEIDVLVRILRNETKNPNGESDCEEVEFEIVADENMMEEEQKVI